MSCPAVHFSMVNINILSQNILEVDYSEDPMHVFDLHGILFVFRRMVFF